MRHLFYKPFWIGNPRAAIIIDQIEIEYENNNEISLLTCNGELKNGCIYNPTHSRLICNSCKYFRKRDLRLLSKPVKVYTISDFADKSINYDNIHWDYKDVSDIKKIKYKNVDLGWSALSAYIELTRNKHPLITKEFRNFFNSFLSSGALLTDVTYKVLDEINPDVVNIFNGRIHTRRPILNVCQYKEVEINVFEHTGFLGEKECKKVLYKNCLPHDIEYNARLIHKTWDDSILSEEEKINIASGFFEKKRKGKNVDDRSYTKFQKNNLLPDGWDIRKKNITIFNSSDDEYAGLNEDWEFKLSSSRLVTLNALFEHFKDNSDFKFYLRVHPNLTNVNYKYVKDLEKLKQHNNLTIIPADSPVSSYALLDASDKIITFGSTIGIEAVYNLKPAIVLNTCYSMGLGSYYMPKNHDELFELVRNDIKPKDKFPALKYAFYRLYRGEKFKYFDPNPFRKREFYFKNKKIVSFNNDYREKMYKGFFPVLINFIKYKQASIPKNIWRKINKNLIPSKD